MPPRQRRDHSDRVHTDAPPVVVGAVTAGVAPLPFLFVYAILFISRGTVHPVTPPDIGNSKTAELIAGLIALALFVIGSLAAFWLLDGRRRWLFMVCQFALFVTTIVLVSDSSTGPPAVPIVLGLTSLAAMVLAMAPASWTHLHQDVPGWLRRGPATKEHIP